MKRIISILLIALVSLSFVACQTPDKDDETTETEKTAADYKPENPDDIIISDEEQYYGYKIYQGYYYYEDGLRYFYDTNEERMYEIPQLIAAIMPSDFYDGLSTGDTVRIKAIDKDLYLQCKQISVVYGGDISDIPEEILAKFVEKNASNHEE